MARTESATRLRGQADTPLWLSIANALGRSRGEKGRALRARGGSPGKEEGESSKSRKEAARGWVLVWRSGGGASGAPSVLGVGCAAFPGAAAPGSGRGPLRGGGCPSGVNFVTGAAREAGFKVARSVSLHRDHSVRSSPIVSMSRILEPSSTRPLWRDRRSGSGRRPHWQVF